MTPFDALLELPKIVDDYKRVSAQLIQAQQELQSLKDDCYVSWKWACAYFNMDEKTARLMLADVPMLVHNKRVKKFKKSDLIRFAERHSVKVKDLSTH